MWMASFARALFLGGFRFLEQQQQQQQKQS
jgi:hypothetical protein